MRVAVRCADPVIAGSVSTVVSAAAGTLVACSDHPALVATWRSVDAVVVDVTAAQALADDRPMGGPAVVVVFDDCAPGRDAWTVGGPVRAAGVIGLPSGESMLLEALVTAPARPRTGGRVVGVVGSGGGAGASSLAVMLAAVAARDRQSVALLDADHRAGGLDLLLGAEGEPGPRWPELIAADSVPAVLARPLCVGGITVVSASRTFPARTSGDPRGPARLVGEVVDALRASHDLVVVDLGSREVEAVAACCDTVLLVCARQVRSAAAAAILCAGLQCASDRRLVATAHGAADLSADDVAAAVGAPLAAALPSDATVAKAAARGELHRLPRRNRSMRTVRRLLVDLSPIPAEADLASGAAAGAGEDRSGWLP